MKDGRDRGKKKMKEDAEGRNKEEKRQGEHKEGRGKMRKRRRRKIRVNWGMNTSFHLTAHILTV